MVMNLLLGAGAIFFVLSIIATGLILNFAGRGALGTTMQDLAKYTTQGYGV